MAKTALAHSQRQQTSVFWESEFVIICFYYLSIENLSKLIRICVPSLYNPRTVSTNVDSATAKNSFFLLEKLQFLQVNGLGFPLF